MKSTENSPSAYVLKKSQPEEFDLVILGGGTGSTIGAWTFAGEGKRVAVVDRKYIGGSCPNIACLPSKNIIHSAKVASYFWRSGEFGISKDNTRINMSGVRDRKRKMVERASFGEKMLLSALVLVRRLNPFLGFRRQGPSRILKLSTWIIFQGTS